MLLEIESAANFLSDLLKLQHNCVSAQQLASFRAAIIQNLHSNYQQHWFPDQPCKGSGYRCLRINHKMDPTVARAGSSSGLTAPQLKQLLPNELTLWIDPNEVSYRIGENGSICVIYDPTSYDFHQNHYGNHNNHRQQLSPSPTHSSHTQSSTLSTSLSSSPSSSTSCSPVASPQQWYGRSAVASSGGGSIGEREKQSFYLNSLLS